MSEAPAGSGAGPGDSDDAPGGNVPTDNAPGSGDDAGQAPKGASAPKKPRLRYDCAVKGCTPSTFEVHSYHKLPNKDNRGRVDPRRARWIEACRLTDADLRERMVICGKHFKVS